MGRGQGDKGKRAADPFSVPQATCSAATCSATGLAAVAKGSGVAGVADTCSNVTCLAMSPDPSSSAQFHGVALRSSEPNRSTLNVALLQKRVLPSMAFLFEQYGSFVSVATISSEYSSGPRCRLTASLKRRSARTSIGNVTSSDVCPGLSLIWCSVPFAACSPLTFASVAQLGIRTASVIDAGVETLSCTRSPHGYAVVTLTATAPSPKSAVIAQGASRARARVFVLGCTNAMCETNFVQPWLKLPVQHGKFGSRFIVVASGPSVAQKCSCCTAAMMAFGCCRY